MVCRLTSRGFSLVSVLVAISLTGVLSLILLNLSDQQNKQQQKAMLDGEINEAVTNLRSIFGNHDACFATLFNKRKGVSLTKVETKHDDDRVPVYAHVSNDIPFRGTKVFLTSLKISSDAEVKEFEKHNPGFNVQPGAVLIQARFRKMVKRKNKDEKSSSPLGGRVINKYFEVRVLYGHIFDVFSPISSNSVVQNCKSKGTNSYIQDPRTDRRADPQESGVRYVVRGYVGHCVVEDPYHSESKIMECFR